MNKEIIKLRYIAPAYITAFTLSVFSLLFVRWLLSIQFEILDIKENIWEIWLPGLLTWIFMHYGLRNRLRILYFENKNGNGHTGFMFLAWASLFPVMMISQNLLTTSTSKLAVIDNIYEIEQVGKSRYYKIKEFEVANHFGGSHALVETSGRYGEKLNISFYFTFPIINSKDETLPKEPKYWYGIVFHKQISSRLEQSRKEAIYDNFYDESLDKVNNYDFHDLIMFERLPTSGAKEQFLKAVSARLKTEPQTGTVILRPSDEAFEDINGDSLEWSLYSFCIGILVFIVFLLFPGYDDKEHKRQLKGYKTKDSDSDIFIDFFIPKRDLFASPILLNLNILVFIVISIAGVSIIQPSGSDLLIWGANRRLETTNGEWWRLISSMFLHGGIVHLLLNCFGLIIASIFVEPVIGKWRFLTVYMLSGICGSLASIWWYENTISVGASGAIFGLFGAILGLLLTNAFPKGGKSGVFSTIGIYVGINLLFGLTGGVDNAAHLGGLVSGFIIGIAVYLLTTDKSKFEV